MIGLGLNLGLASSIIIDPATRVLRSGFFWIDAGESSTVTEDSGRVAQIDDITANNIDFSQTNTGRQPTYTDPPGEMFFDGTADRLQAFENDVTSEDSAVTLPDASGSTATKGFTCTGLDRDSEDGTFWVGNDGRGDPGDTSYEPSVVNLSADGTTVISEIDVIVINASATSVQGVVEDTSDNTLWFALPSENLIYNVEKDGTGASSLSITGVNGLGYNSTTDQLITLTSSGSLRLRNKTTGASESTWALSGSNWDQVHFDASRNGIWITQGANGSDGNLYFWDIATESLSAATSLGGADAIEGVVVEGDTVYIMNDAYFHTGSPALNRLLTYTVDTNSAAGTAPLRSEVDFFIGFKISGTLTPTDALFTSGDPVDQTATGFGFYLPNTTTLRTFIYDGTNQRFVDVTVDDMSTLSLINVSIDIANETVTVYQDGTLKGSGATGTLDASIQWNQFRLGTSPDGRFAPATIRNAALNDRVLSAGDREAVGMKMCGDIGVTYVG